MEGMESKKGRVRLSWWLRGACNMGDLGSISGSGRSPGEWNDYSLQYSCLGNCMDRGACSKWVISQQRELTTSARHLAQELPTNVQCSGGSRSFAKETRALKMRSVVVSH